MLYEKSFILVYFSVTARYSIIMSIGKAGDLVMEKTYKLLDHTEPISMEEIRRLYMGHWVYIVKAKLTDTGELIEGIPVVIGAVPHDGVEDGIYEKYDTDEYVERFGLSLRYNKDLQFIISSLSAVGEANG